MGIVVPADSEEVVELGADRFALRLMRREDAGAYADFIARIDESDLRRRFFHANSLSPEADFERCVAGADAREVAFVAERESPSGAAEIVGEARVYQYEGSSTAEVAIIVRSDMQRRGLGRALMRKTIAYCAAQGLEMIARIRSDNAAMVRLAKCSGMQVEHRPGSEVVIAHMRPLP